MITLIPAYQPGKELPQVVRGVQEAAAEAGYPLRIIVVNDGSTPQHDPIFAACEAAGAVILTHPVNRGKGAALQTGLSYCATHYPDETVVTADADGQHLPADIVRVAAAAEADRTLTLGVRDFSAATLPTGEKTTVPARSRLGNAVTCVLFRAATGWALSDTQTGLRAFPPALVPWAAAVPGTRYEYELRMLLAAACEGLQRQSLPIRAVYSPGNTSSHFRPLADSSRIYRPLLSALVARLRCDTTRSFVLFTAASLFCTLLDYALALTLASLTSLVFLPLALARAVSSITNFVLNRSIFTRGPAARTGEERTLWQALWRYFALVGVVLAGAYLLVRIGLGCGIPLWLAKLIADTAMFVLSFVVQRTLVFYRCAGKRKNKSPEYAQTHSPTNNSKSEFNLDCVDNVY